MFLSTKLMAGYMKSYIRVSNEARKVLVDKIPNLENKTKVFKNIVSKHFISKIAKENVCLMKGTMVKRL